MNSNQQFSIGNLILQKDGPSSEAIGDTSDNNLLL